MLTMVNQLIILAVRYTCNCFGQILSNSRVEKSKIQDFHFYVGQFKDGRGKKSGWRKPLTFGKQIHKLSQTRICPEWDSNLGVERHFDPYIRFRPIGHRGPCTIVPI